MAGCMFENQETPIKQAILNDDASALRIALAKGENVHLVDRKCNTYLHYVCTMHRPVTFHILVGSGINLNAQNRHGNTALHVTALQNECCHVGDLLAAGIDPFIKNKDGKTAAEIKTKNMFWTKIYAKYQPGIFQAVANHDVDKVIYLLHCWSRVDTKREKQTLRQFTAAHKFHDLVFHIDFHAPTLGAIYAVLEGDDEKAWKFLSHPKCDVNFLNYAANSTHILQYALRLGNVRIIRMICKANINVNVRVRVHSYLKAPLYFCAIDVNFTEDVMWCVLKSKPDFSLQDERGRNAGVYALDKTKGKISIEFIEYMIKNGLDVSQRDCTGVTIRDVARLARRRDIVNIVDKTLVKIIRSSDIARLEELAVVGYDSLLITFNYRDSFIYASGNETEEAVAFVQWLPKFYEEVQRFLNCVQHWSADLVIDLLKSVERPDLLINAKDKGGRAAIHICVLQSRFDILQFLLTCPGIDVNTRDNMGRTAYHYASCIEANDDREKFCQLLESSSGINTDICDFSNHKASYYISHPQKASHWINTERKAKYGMSKQLACVDKYEELCHIFRCKRKTLKHFESSICQFQYPVAQFNKILQPVMTDYQDLIFLAMEMGKEEIAVRLLQLGTDWTLEELCKVKKADGSSELVLMSVTKRAEQLGMNHVLKTIEQKRRHLENKKTFTKNVEEPKKMALVRHKMSEREASQNSFSSSIEVEFVMEPYDEQEESSGNNTLNCDIDNESHIEDTLNIEDFIEEIHYSSDEEIDILSLNDQTV